MEWPCAASPYYGKIHAKPEPWAMQANDALKGQKLLKVSIWPWHVFPAHGRHVGPTAFAHVRMPDGMI